MPDPINLYLHSFHPVETMLNKDCSGSAKHFTRTQRPPKYYFIRADTILQTPTPEMYRFGVATRKCLSFRIPTSPAIHSLRMFSTLKKRGFEFMKPLVADMIQADPAERPNMNEVVSRFAVIRRELNGRKLRARPVGTDEDLFDRIARTTSHWKRRIVFVAKGVSAIPDPPDT
ncbi:hypothetical protein JVT61DRAFT_8035 [Boletus reticuloceps]|uniref:Uncharacterized protein n=1 Tax=Boletus reticuloceps TaxID=495285 RepID=A0A8I2YHP4_9AGAM|nr:hypothetical protein JVT61DRAFT_8035 [Boletus reticuloceps]